MEEIIKIAGFILTSFLHIWPYLLITIPLAVYVRFSGASGYITKVLTRRPLIAILMATIIGAISPFCSCGVIPVITSLLIGGVPLGPVMSFWIASPSMDPEIFFLSVATIGWKLSLWRLGSTFLISLLSGYITHYLIHIGWLGQEVLRIQPGQPANNTIRIKSNYSTEISKFRSSFYRNQEKTPIAFVGTRYSPYHHQNAVCCIETDHVLADNIQRGPKVAAGCSCHSPGSRQRETNFAEKLWKATLDSTWMVVKFMSLAFFINALISLYIPTDYMNNFLGGKGNLSIFIATLTGIPVYTSNMTALPFINGLLAIGMNPAAALAFLISGPTTTLPAMVAVWGIARRKIFFLYVAFIFFGALLTGYLYALLN